MIMAIPRCSLFTLIFIIAISSITFIFGYFLNINDQLKEKTKKMFIASIGISSVILILAFFKYTFLQDIFFKNPLDKQTGASDYIFIIGISYSSFKMMHFIIESYNRRINKLNFITFINYIIFFPSFISGPINRYNHFVEQYDSLSNNDLGNDFRKGAERIVNGIFKKIVLCAIIYPYTLVNMQGAVGDLSLSSILLGLYAYTLYFYFDFSGYTDLAIGCARIIGLGLPENFNNPFMKKNIQQLWASWHMSLTGWLTDYIYWPLSKRLRKVTFFRSNPILLSNISIIVTFIICGMWHGEKFNFILWGTYHGIGLAILNMYQKKKRKIKNKILRDYFQSKYSYWIGVIGTFHFFVFGILLFSLNAEEIKAFLLRFF